ncbi:MAG: hypothetical protein OEY41_05710 [Acidimicrobiia bacterium]|nr:hypothetical protein [Acidimicrobiia bacterium]
MDIRAQQLMLGPQVCGSPAEASARETPGLAVRCNPPPRLIPPRGRPQLG